MSRRCLICANINPCSEHTEEAQLAELARKDAAIAEIRRPTPVGGEREAVARIMTALRASASAYCADDWHGALPEWLETDDAAHAILSTLSLIEVRGATHYAWITPPSAAGRAAQGCGADLAASAAGHRPHHAGR